MEGTPASAADQALTAAVRSVTAAFDALAAIDVVGVSESVLLEAVVDLERQVRRAPSFQHVTLAELTVRGTVASRGYADLPSLLVDVWRVSSVEARSRVNASLVLGPQRTVHGQALGPVLALVARRRRPRTA
jgi:hypothetical protein